MKRVTRDNVAAVGTFHEYRKKTTTRLAFLTEPFTIETKEGPLRLDETHPEWDGGYYVSLPEDGDPYPVSPRYVRENYERV